MNTTTEYEMEARPSLNPHALDKLVGQVVGDLGAAVNGALVVLGDRLGIYSELAKIGPASRINSPQRQASTSVSSVNG